MIGLQSVLAATVTGAFVVGMIMVLLGGLRLRLAKRLGLADARVDWLLSALNLTLIPMMLASGILIDEFGVRNVLIVGSLLTAGAVFALAVSSSTLQALGAILLAGAGGACLSTGSTVLMPHAFFPEHSAASQNLGNVFFALGALLTPPLAGRLLERLSFRQSLSLLAIACLLPALAAAITARGVFPDAELKAGDLAKVLGHPLLWLAGVVLFLYAPLEQSLGTWAGRYLTDLGFRERGAAWLVTGFWLAFLAARLLAAFLEQGGLLARTTWQGALIVVLALAAAMTLGNLAGARKGVSAAAGLLAVGALLGPIFPTLVGMLFDFQPFQAVRGTAYGAMFAIGALGNLFLPPLIGAYARRSTIQRSMRIDMLMGLAMALVALFLVLLSLV